MSIDIKLEGIIRENIIVTQATLDALQFKCRMHREQAIPIELDGYGRQTGDRTSGQTLGHSDGFLDFTIGQGAHMIWAEITQVDDPAQRHEHTYPDDAM